MPAETIAAALIDPDKRRAWAQRDPSPNAKPPSPAGLARRGTPLSRLRGDMSSPARRFAGRLEALVDDHSWVRALYWNFHPVAPGIYRSAQPSAGRIGEIARLGVRTVVNLRGERDCATYLEEVAACRRLGLDLVDFPMRSRLAPRPERLLALGDLFETAPRPLLLHCKTGADRTGFASALYLLDIEGAPVALAKRQLRLRYGHLWTTRAGILGVILDRYAVEQQRTGISFRAWLNDGYDPRALMEDFAPSPLARLWPERLFDPD